MPAVITATTLDALEVLFVATIKAIVPTYQQDEATRFKHLDRAHRAAQNARWFRLEWDDEGPTDGGWFGANAYDSTAILSIFVDYGGVPRQVVKRMAASDHAQMHDALVSLQASNNSLMRVRRIDWDFAEENRGDQAQIVHQYEVGWIRARSVTTS